MDEMDLSPMHLECTFYSAILWRIKKIVNSGNDSASVVRGERDFQRDIKCNI